MSEDEDGRRRRGFFGWFRRAPTARVWKHRHAVFWPTEDPVKRGFIVHGKCADGFTSAALLLNRYPDGFVLYAQPSELAQRLSFVVRNPPSELLVIADLSAQASELDDVVERVGRIAKTCRVVWLDHHAPQWPLDFEKRLRAAGAEVHVDRAKRESGASLVATWTKVADPALLRVADLVRRRDAWTDPTNPHARAWVAVAGARRRDYVEKVADGRLDGLEEEGLRLVAEKDKRVAKILRSKIRRPSPRVAWLWAFDDTSDVAEALFESSPALVFLRFGRTGRVSVRSRQEAPIAAELAQTFGGGGHANAAGFGLDLTGWPRLRYRLLRGRDPALRKVLEEAERIALRAKA